LVRRSGWASQSRRLRNPHFSSFFTASTILSDVTMYSLSRDADCGESERAATSAETPHVFTLYEDSVKT
jgi:hypothetical protein